MVLNLSNGHGLLSLLVHQEITSDCVIHFEFLHTLHYKVSRVPECFHFLNYVPVHYQFLVFYTTHICHGKFIHLYERLQLLLKGVLF